MNTWKVSVILSTGGERAASAPVEVDINRSDPLSSLVESLCQKLSAPGDHSSYCLQIESNKHYLEDADLSRVEFSIPTNSTLWLKLKPTTAASSTIQALKEGNLAAKKKAIFDLRGLLKDEKFAHEFLHKNGISYITQLIGESTGNTLAYGLSALQEAMTYGFGYDSLTPEFIEKIVGYTTSSNLNVSKSAVEILVLLSVNPQYGFKVLSKAFTATATAQSQEPFVNLLNLLTNPDVNIQLNALTLVNNLIGQSVTDGAYQSFTEALEKLGIYQLLKKSCTSSDPEVRKQLYTFQRVKLRNLKALRDQVYSKQNTEHEESLMKLWNLTFPNVKLETRVSEQWKLLGFQGTDPATDFRGMGLLGLNNLLYFAEKHPDIFRKIVTVQAERKERDYPVAVAGINVTQMLVDLFHVTQEVDTNSGNFTVFTVLFDHGYAFEEIYCIAFRVLDTTWDEMNASYMDFPKVIAAVRKQISDVLSTSPSTIDQFMRAATWSGRSKNQVSITSEDQTSDPEPVIKLRNKIRQEMLDMVRQQRTSFLTQGGWFKVAKPKGKQVTYNYYRLADNKQDILTGTTTSQSVIPSELTVAAKLSDVADLVTGTNIPIFAKQKKLSPQEEEIAAVSFSLILKEAGKSVDFTANSKDDFITWTDGLRFLLPGGFERIENKDTIEEIKALTNLELRVKLIELEGFAQVPSTPPPLPNPIPDFE